MLPGVTPPISEWCPRLATKKMISPLPLPMPLPLPLPLSLPLPLALVPGPALLGPESDPA